MKKLLYKEFRLAASPLSYCFVLGALLTFAPGYPILLGAFFTTLGIFYSFQTMRENNDITYSLLLPVAKSAVVKSKFAFTVLLELCSFAIMAVITCIRMTLLQGAEAYRTNALMGANLVFLGFALLLFGLFNCVFVGGFFKTAYAFGKPFFGYCAIMTLVILTAETLHHIPGLEALNTLGFQNVGLQATALCIGIAAFVLLTLTAILQSVKRFEALDL